MSTDNQAILERFAQGESPAILAESTGMTIREINAIAEEKYAREGDKSRRDAQYRAVWEDCKDADKLARRIGVSRGSADKTLIRLGFKAQTAAGLKQKATIRQDYMALWEKHGDLEKIAGRRGITKTAVQAYFRENKLGPYANGAQPASNIGNNKIEERIELWEKYGSLEKVASVVGISLKAVNDYYRVRKIGPWADKKEASNKEASKNGIPNKWVSEDVNNGKRWRYNGTSILVNPGTIENHLREYAAIRKEGKSPIDEGIFEGYNEFLGLTVSPEATQEATQRREDIEKNRFNWQPPQETS